MKLLTDRGGRKFQICAAELSCQFIKDASHPDS